MASTLVHLPETVPAPLRHAWRNGVIVASDGRAPSDAALIAARKLAPHATFGVLSVVPLSPNERSRLFPPRTPTRDAHVALIEDQVRRLFGEAPDVWIETRSGDPAAVIASYVTLRRTQLLITGIGRARVIDRLLGDESTLAVVRLAKTPVFAVAPGCAAPARRIVVAMDFTPTSVRAARLALELAAADAEVMVANVQAPNAPPPADYAMRRIVDLLQTGFCGRIIPRVLHGDPGTELISIANAWAADAIAVGLHGHAPAERLGIGAVATRVVRCASCSVIAAPREDAGASGDS